MATTTLGGSNTDVNSLIQGGSGANGPLSTATQSVLQVPGVTNTSTLTSAVELSPPNTNLVSIGLTASKVENQIIDVTTNAAIVLTNVNNVVVSTTVKSTVTGGSSGTATIIGSNEGGLFGSSATGDGKTTVFGGAGNTTFVGASGQNTFLSAVNTKNQFILAGGSNTVTSQGKDEIFTSGGQNTIFGGAGVEANQTFVLGGGRNALDAGAGNDTIFAGLGEHAVTGGKGADTFAVNQRGGTTLITDFTKADDTLGFLGFTSSVVGAAVSNAVQTTVFGGTSTQITVSEGGVTTIVVLQNTASLDGLKIGF